MIRIKRRMKRLEAMALGNKVEDMSSSDEEVDSLQIDHIGT